MNADIAGRQVEEILDTLAASGDRAAGAAEELVRVLMDFYGTGLARITALLAEQEGDPLAALLGDETVSGLLVLHSLHPEDTEARIARALHAAGSDVPPGSAEFDELTGTLRLPAPGGGCGCGSSGGAAQERIEAALSCFAPEVTAVEMSSAPAVREPVLLQIGQRPSGQRPAATAGAS
jgi:Fe-S cluster biogenesis protein NfuA